MGNKNNLPAAAPGSAPEAPPVVAATTPSPGRRRFVLGALGTSVLAVCAGVPVWRKVEGVLVVAQPTAADLELAAMGEQLQQSKPDAARQLESSARQAADLAADTPIDWRSAQAARAVLTAPARVQAEFGRGDTVYVGGWLLAHSEMGLALLFAAANAGSNARHGAAAADQPAQPQPE